MKSLCTKMAATLVMALTLLTPSQAATVVNGSGLWPDGSDRDILATFSTSELRSGNKFAEAMQLSVSGLNVDGQAMSALTTELSDSLRPHWRVNQVATNSTGLISWMQTEGAIRFEAPLVPLWQKGGWFEIRNLRIDLDNKVATGVMSGQSDSGQVIVERELTIFTFFDMYGMPFFSDGSLGSLELRFVNWTEDALNEVIVPSLEPLFFGSRAWEELPAFDNIEFVKSIATPVPEPSTWLMMGAGLVGLMLVSRRKPMRSVP